MLCLKFPCVFLRPIMREQIIQKATELFLNYGFKSVTMDEIANAMGISKKTIYVHFKTKSALVETTTLDLFEVISNAISCICDLEKNPVEEIYDIKNVVMDHLKNERSSPQYQLQKYYPTTFKTLKSKQFEMMQSCVTHNLNRGVSLGVYRKDIDIDFISRLYFSSLLAIRNNDMFPLRENSMTNLLEQFYEYHLRGICTKKGLKTLNNFINKTTVTTDE